MKHAPNRENRVRTSRKRPRADLNCVIEFDRKAKGALLGKKNYCTTVDQPRTQGNSLTGEIGRGTGGGEERERSLLSTLNL